MYSLVNIHFARMFDPHTQHRFGEYYSYVMRTRFINYELVAGDAFLDRLKGHKPSKNNMYANCVLPLYPLVHLRIQDFKQYLERIQPQRSDELLQVMDCKSKQRVAEDIFDHTLCLVILWLSAI